MIDLRFFLFVNNFLHILASWNHSHRVVSHGHGNCGYATSTVHNQHTPLKVLNPRRQWCHHHHTQIDNDNDNVHQRCINNSSQPSTTMVPPSPHTGWTTTTDSEKGSSRRCVSSPRYVFFNTFLNYINKFYSVYTYCGGDVRETRARAQVTDMSRASRYVFRYTFLFYPNSFYSASTYCGNNNNNNNNNNNIQLG